MRGKKKADVPLWFEANLDVITPLELAKLAIGLKQAGFIPAFGFTPVSNPDDRDFIGNALKFLDVSADVLNIRREAVAYKKQNDKFDEDISILIELKKFPRQFSDDYVSQLRDQLGEGMHLFELGTFREFVPVVKIMKRLGTVQLTPEELASIEVKGEWDNFTPKDKSECAFFFLTREPLKMKDVKPVPSEGKWYITTELLCVPERRDEMIREGVKAYSLPSVWRLLKTAHDQRNHRQKVKAPKKPKPRAPKGDDGKFKKKTRGPSGEYARQEDRPQDGSHSP